MFTPSTPDISLMNGGEPPEISFLGNGNGSFAMGAARPDRIIVVAVQYESDASVQVSVPTCNGVAMTAIDRRTAPDPMGLFYAVVPTGTTATIANGETRTSTWMITNVNQLADSVVGSGSTASISLTRTMPSAPAAIIGIARTRSEMTSGTMSGSGVITGVTVSRVFNSAAAASGGVFGYALTTGAGSGTLTFTSGVAFSSGLSAMAIFTE